MYEQCLISHGLQDQPNHIDNSGFPFPPKFGKNLAPLPVLHKTPRSPLPLLSQLVDTIHAYFPGQRDLHIMESGGWVIWILK